MSLRPMDGGRILLATLIALAIAGLACEHQAFALEPFKGTVYAKGSLRKAQLFKIVNTEKRDGANVVSTMITYDLDGKPAVTEELFETAGADGKSKVEHYRLTQHQTAERGEVELSPKGDIAVFKWARDGKNKVSTENVGANFVVPMTLHAYMRAHWAEIAAGQKVSFRLACLDRQETVGFTFFKSGEVTRDGKPHVQVTMEASSWLIRKIVDPIVFTVTADGARIPDFVGRVMAKMRKGPESKDWKDLDAEFVVE